MILSYVKLSFFANGILLIVKRPKLIFLNGFAGSGKSTLAKKYIDEHKFALGFEGDNFIVMFGQWRSDWYGAAELKLIHSKNIVRKHLELGYDVVLPFLLQKSQHAEEYRQMAEETGADFFEFYLDLPREEAIGRLLVRGSWGEPGSPPFTDDDRPEIEDLFDQMDKATNERKDCIRIVPQSNEIEQTYQKLISHLDD